MYVQLYHFTGENRCRALCSIRYHQAKALEGCAVADANYMRVPLTLNGKPCKLFVDSRETLLDTLREQLGLPGTKKGCDRGECGACTVLVEGRRINACMTLTVMQAGKHIVTIEGLAEGGLHPVQAAFIEHDGFQCGYCTSGQIMSAVACIREGHAGSPESVREWMSGNICRCGAYPNIVNAVMAAAEKL